MCQENTLSISLNRAEFMDWEFYISWRFWNKKNKILLRKLLTFLSQEELYVIHPEG